MNAIQINRFGNEEVLEYKQLSIPKLEDAQVLVKISHIGVNYIDVYFRSGLYPTELPFTPGYEAAGIIEQSRSELFKIGDRVVYFGYLGAYAEYATVPDRHLVKIPEQVSFQDATAVAVQGVTAHYLANSTFNLDSSKSCLIHAGAGGVGLLLTQIAKLKGATVITTVSNSVKEQISKAAGADYVINYKENDFETEVKKLTNGLDVVYDSVGKTTFDKGLNCLKPRGTMVTFGQSSGSIERIDPLILSKKGSIYITRPRVADYVQSRDELEWRCSEIFSLIVSKKLVPRISDIFALKDAIKAHQKLESRNSIGKILLIP